MGDEIFTRKEVFIVIFVCVVAGLWFGGLIGYGFGQENSNVVVLGGSICLETYGSGSEYVSYSDGVLECSSAVDVLEYDGILVKQVGGLS